MSKQFDIIEEALQDIIEDISLFTDEFIMMNVFSTPAESIK